MERCNDLLLQVRKTSDVEIRPLTETESRVVEKLRLHGNSLLKLKQYRSICLRNCYLLKLDLQLPELHCYRRQEVFNSYVCIQGRRTAVSYWARADGP